MKFNSSNKEKQNNNGHSPMKHTFHMVLCCGLPIVIILSLPFVARFSPASAGVLGVIAPFICPVMMGGMIFMMFGKKKKGCCDNTNIETENTELPTK